MTSVTPNEDLERKFQWLIFFTSHFQVEWEMVCQQKFGVLFTCGLLTSVMFLIRPYDLALSSNLPAVYSCHFDWIALFFTLNGARFLLNKFVVTLLTSLPKMTVLTFKWLFFTSAQEDKVNWVCVTLIGVYLRAANRSSNKFSVEITSQGLRKEVFHSVCFFYPFFETTTDLRNYRHVLLLFLFVFLDNSLCCLFESLSCLFLAICQLYV